MMYLVLDVIAVLVLGSFLWIVLDHNEWLDVEDAVLSFVMASSIVWLIARHFQLLAGGAGI